MGKSDDVQFLDFGYKILPKYAVTFIITFIMRNRERVFVLKVQVPEISDAHARQVTQRWQSACDRAADGINKARRAVVGNRRQFRDKIARQLIKYFPYYHPALEGYYRDKGLSRQGLIIAYRKKVLRSAPKYLSKLNRMFRRMGGIKAKEYKNCIKETASLYQKSAMQSVFPLTLSEPPGKSLVSLATMALANMPALHKQYLKPGDKINGRPIRICLPDKIADFKKALNNQLMKSGSAILQERAQLKWWLNALASVANKPSSRKGGCGGFYYAGIRKASRRLDEKLKQANKGLNGLAEKYRPADVAPFRPGGASHIDFMLNKMTVPITEEYKMDLSLEIQVTFT